MQNKILGVASAFLIITSALHISIYFQKGGVLEFMTASVRDSQQKTAPVEQRELTGQELYAIIKHLNKQIEAAVSPADSKAKGQRGSGSAGGASTNITPVDGGDGTGGGSGSGSTGETTEQNSYSIPVQDVEAKVIGAARTEVNNVATRQESSYLEGLLKSRKNLMGYIATVNPRFFLLSVLPNETKAAIPNNLQNYLEKDVVLKGRVEVVYVDDFENYKNSSEHYSLNVDNNKYGLYLTSAYQGVSGAELSIGGLQIDQIVVADSENVVEMSREPISDSVGEQKTLVLLIYFNNSEPNPNISAAQMENRIFNGQFQNFYREQSYAKTYFTGDVLGWLHVNRNCTSLGWGWGDYSATREVITELIEEDGIDLSGYDRLVLAVNGECGGIGNSTVGKVDLDVGGATYHMSLASIRANRASFSQYYSGVSSTPQPFDWTTFDHVLSHEMGHSLGVRHANGWDCGTDVLYGQCNHHEYGNIFDTMGWGGYSLHFNSFYKELLGWMPSENVISISSSGNYSLNPIELPYGKLVAKIKTPGSSAHSFYIEYRRGIGFDTKLNNEEVALNQNGLFVNRIARRNTFLGIPYPRLLDMLPTADTWLVDTLRPTIDGQAIFEDPSTGISIGPVTSVTAESIKFDVSISPAACVHRNPTVGVGGASVAVGSDTVLTVAYGNSDSFSCGGSNFTVKTDMPESWITQITPNGSEFVIPNDEQVADHEKFFDLSIPQDVQPNVYYFTATITNLGSGLKTEELFVVDVFVPVTITDILPISGQVLTNVSLSGSNFSNNPTLEIVGEHGSTYISGINSSGSYLSFEFPDQIYGNDCPNAPFCPLINTPPGTYVVIVRSESGYTSNPVIFEVAE